MMRKAIAGTLIACLLAGCSGDSSRSVVVGSSTAPVQSQTPTPGPSAAAVGAQLEADMLARKQAYVVHSAAGTAGSYYQVLAQLETGATTVPRAPLEAMFDFMDQRKDTADFKCSALVRIVYLHGNNPAIPSDLRGRARTTLQNFKYWIDEPGQDDMVFWSENHQILFASSEYLAGQLYPTSVFPNSGLTGDQHRQKARPRILRWLDQRLRWGFSEWYSPVYYPHDVAPLLNLVDFAQDPEIQTRASMVLDLLVFDLARLTVNGSFGTTSGRIYEEHKWTGRRQSIGDMIEILFATRGGWRGKGSTAATNFATSTYRVPQVLLAIGQDKQRARYVERARVGVDFSEAAQEGLGFTSNEDGMTWWGMGAYTAPETIVLTRRMIRDYDLWHTSWFGMFSNFNWMPDALLPTISGTLSPASEGSALTGADTYCFRNPHAQLSSVQRYNTGKVGFQQHAWQATLDLDCSVWTTAPATFGRSGPGEWTGSGSLPHVVQVEDVLVALYNPTLGSRTLFPAATHAWFPRADFDEVVTQGKWTCARKGEGYVALYSAQPTAWQTGGAYAGKELMANGYRNVWICQVGNQAEDGSFADFVNAVTSASLTTQGQGNAPFADPLSVQFDAPGLGLLEAGFRDAATLNGAPVHDQKFPRFDTPYAQQAWGDPVLNVQHAGLSLQHERVSGSRSGDGL